MCQSTVRKTWGAVLSRPAQPRPASLAGGMGGLDPRAVGGEGQPPAAAPGGAGQRLASGLEPPLQGGGQRRGGRRSAWVKPE